MKIISIDDEVWPSNLLKLMVEQIKNNNPDFSEVEFTSYFTNTADAMIYLENNIVDLIFLDVEMPGMNGLEFAAQIEALNIQSKIVFVTAYSNYALDAWKTSAIDYLLKPFDSANVERALKRALPKTTAGNKIKTTDSPLFFRCFPKFELLVNGTPKAFQSKRAKELLAYLIHNQGCWVEIGTLVYEMFGDLDEKSCKSHYRVILARLKKELASCNAENIIETKYGAVRVNIPIDSCDYYMLLEGRNVELFRGEYMQDYSWAEAERTRLFRKYNLQQ